MYKNFLKRLFDFVLSGIGLVVLSPLILIVCILLYFANKGAGVFFTQERPGKDGKTFKIIKFKTMSEERDTSGKHLPDDLRLTKLGRLIRSLSIDEIPQLINVFVGDMALIGPRPLLVQYLPKYSPDQMRRHEVRPGITGWAQVHGRNLLKLSKKFEYDVWYVDHLSFGLDIKILFLTIMNVVKRSDIGEGAVNMDEVDDLRFSDKYDN